MVTTTDTREVIMAIAKPMVQARGYNALSFRDVAREVGVKSASVHYHFPTKGDLGAALAGRYADEAKAFFDGLSLEPSAFDQTITAYTGVFRSALENDNRMCLCGIMAAEYDGLPAAVRTQIDRFTDVNVEWLAMILSRHKPKVKTETIREQAVAAFAAIEGAQLVSRGQGDIKVFDRCIHAYRAAGLLS
jgi:TetR/AcrR family transcriptional regulator, transcriptional repressor for nem operon